MRHLQFKALHVLAITMHGVQSACCRGISQLGTQLRSVNHVQVGTAWCK